MSDKLIAIVWGRLTTVEREAATRHLLASVAASDPDAVMNAIHAGVEAGVDAANGNGAAPVKATRARKATAPSAAPAATSTNPDGTPKRKRGRPSRAELAAREAAASAPAATSDNPFLAPVK